MTDTVETTISHSDDDDVDRAVTARDYRVLALEASDDVKIAGALGPQLHTDNHPPLWRAGDPWTFGGLDRSRGNVNVIIVPDADVDKVDSPQPTLDLLRAVQAYLDARRTLTARLAVTGPRYLPITVVADVVTRKKAVDDHKVKPGQLAGEVAQAIQRYLHPLSRPHRCWRVGESVDVAKLVEAVAPRDDLGFISAITVTPATPLYHFPPLGPGGPFIPLDERPELGPVGATVPVADYELVCWDRQGSQVNDKGIA
jgi:Baseplate J-like protein